jgi:CRP/FNR family transcriptional regulator, cyclic AMP receptor protein
MPVPIELLQHVPLFKRVDDRGLKLLAASFTERPFKEGATLTAEGKGGAGFFVIEHGTAVVTVDGAERRTLGPGDYYGEIGLVDGGVRTATITATSDGRAYGLTAWQFRPLVEEDTTIAWSLLEALASRIREIEASAG